MKIMKFTLSFINSNPKEQENEELLNYTTMQSKTDTTNLKTETKDTQESSPKEPLTISQQVMLTFDPLKKVVNEQDQMMLIEVLSENDQASAKLNKIIRFHDEVYIVGKTIGIRYAKQRVELLQLKSEVEVLRKENENLKANIK